MKYKAPLIGVLLAVVITVGWWFLLYKPAMAKQTAFEAETVELEGRQDQLRTEIALLEEIRDDEERYRATAALLQDYIPDGVTQAEAVRQLQRAADAARVKITSMTFGELTPVVGAPVPIEPNTALASIGITMDVEGGYFQTVDFFRRVEVDVPRAVLTQSANLTEGEQSFPSLATTWTGQLFAVVPVSATVVPEDPGAAPGEETEGQAEGTTPAAEDAGEVSQP